MKTLGLPFIGQTRAISPARSASKGLTSLALRAGVAPISSRAGGAASQRRTHTNPGKALILFQKSCQIQLPQRQRRRRTLADRQVQLEQVRLEDHRLKGIAALVDEMKLLSDIGQGQRTIRILLQLIEAPAPGRGGQLLGAEMVGARTN